MIDLPERVLGTLLGNKAYDADAIRSDLAMRNIEAEIPDLSNRREKMERDRTLCKRRNCIERRVGHLELNRAIVTRYDQLAETFLGVVHTT